MRGGYTKAQASLEPRPPKSSLATVAFFPLFPGDGAFRGFEPAIVADSAAI
jgi:hypothetical protein